MIYIMDYTLCRLRNAEKHFEIKMSNVGLGPKPQAVPKILINEQPY